MSAARRRRGMTLLEVVLALTLLSVVGAAIAPLLLEARRAVHAKAPARDAFDLGRLADLAIEKPQLVGLDPDAEAAEIRFPDAPDLAPVQVRRHEREGFAWVTFVWERLAVARVVPLKKENATPPAEAKR